MTPSLEKVDALYGNRVMNDMAATMLIDMADRLADLTFGGTVSRLSEVEGDVDDFKTLLAAHLWALREREASSESQTGGSVTFSVTPGELRASLSESRFGRMASAYLRDSVSIGVRKVNSL